MAWSLGGSVNTRYTADQALQLRLSDTALPVREINRMILAEPKRSLRSVDRNRDQAFAVAAMGGLVAYPVGFDRRGRPADDDRAGFVQLCFNQLGKSGAAVDECVPPDGDAGGGQGVSDRCNARTIRAGIAQEDRGAARR